MAPRGCQRRSPGFMRAEIAAPLWAPGNGEKTVDASLRTKRTNLVINFDKSYILWPCEGAVGRRRRDCPIAYNRWQSEIDFTCHCQRSRPASSLHEAKSIDNHGGENTWETKN